MVTFLFALILAQAPAPLAATDFANSVPGEGVATIAASCERCDWGVEGREAATARITVDGRYSQHLVLARGEKESNRHECVLSS